MERRPDFVLNPRSFYQPMDERSNWITMIDLFYDGTAYCAAIEVYGANRFIAYGSSRKGVRASPRLYHNEQYGTCPAVVHALPFDNCEPAHSNPAALVIERDTTIKEGWMCYRIDMYRGDSLRCNGYGYREGSCLMTLEELDVTNNTVCFSETLYRRRVPSIRFFRTRQLTYL